MIQKLYQTLLQKGYPEPFAKEIITKYMNTDYTASRMLSYLVRQTRVNVEDLVDEMYAILESRNQIIEKKKMEHAQSVINDVYNKGL